MDPDFQEVSEVSDFEILKHPALILTMQTRSMSKQKHSKFALQSQYNLRPRNPINIQDGLGLSSQQEQRQELFEQLRDACDNKCIILDDDMIRQLQQHPYKKYLRAYSLPIPNNKDLAKYMIVKNKHFI